MDAQSKFKVLGLMSGTSLDGLDIACVELRVKKSAWSFKILAAETKKYSGPWLKRLSSAHELPPADLLALDVAYGKFLAQCCRQALKKWKPGVIDLIASHGHTIFHQPERGFTYQLGSGNALHAFTGIPVACDFRSMDVALGGEGAPLVPAGDRLLFHHYDVCLNLGGIANLSYERLGQREAFDICFANMGLNHLAGKADQLFDKNGRMAKSGSLNQSMLAQLNACYASFQRRRPSLGREGFELKVQPILDQEEIPLPDRFHTFTKSIALEIRKSIPRSAKALRLLATGGGAHNDFLIASIRKEVGPKVNVIVPDQSIVDFKEALVFALLGVLRLRGEVNCLKSVTGATKDSCSGVLVGV